MPSKLLAPAAAHRAIVEADAQDKGWYSCDLSPEQLATETETLLRSVGVPPEDRVGLRVLVLAYPPHYKKYRAPATTRFELVREAGGWRLTEVWRSTAISRRNTLYFPQGTSLRTLRAVRAKGWKCPTPEVAT